jgi:hypothetical protein
MTQSADVAQMLDHIVVNAMFETDAAAACFTALGFALTPRGYHSLGSVNHLMMFGDHYLELVGLPVGATTVRREILESRLGIDGLVFSSGDAPATYARLRAAGIDASEPQSFSRPVQIDGAEQLASFTTTRLTPGELPAGRVYFCQHLTPQWVFRDEWTQHPNGARALRELIVVSADPAREAQRYALAAGQGEVVPSAEETGVKLRLRGFDLSFVTDAQYRVRYGALASNAADRGSYFGALVVEVADLASISTRLAAMTAQADCAITVADTTSTAGQRSIAVLLNSLNTLIEFIGTVEHAHS